MTGALIATVFLVTVYIWQRFALDDAKAKIGVLADECARLRGELTDSPNNAEALRKQVEQLKAEKQMLAMALGERIAERDVALASKHRHDQMLEDLEHSKEWKEYEG